MTNQHQRDSEKAGQGDTSPASAGSAPYGFCPHCGARGVTRERRPDGDDVCANGHTYPSRYAVGENQNGRNSIVISRGVVIRQLGVNYWTAYDNSSGRNDREGYGKTREEAMADFRRKCFEPAVSRRKG